MNYITPVFRNFILPVVSDLGKTVAVGSLVGVGMTAIVMAEDPNTEFEPICNLLIVSTVASSALRALSFALGKEATLSMALGLGVGATIFTYTTEKPEEEEEEEEESDNPALKHKCFLLAKTVGLAIIFGGLGWAASSSPIFKRVVPIFLA